MKIQCQSEISLSPERVFPWIAEPEKAMQWQKNVKGGKIIKDNPEIVGTTFEEIIEEDGKSLTMKGIITQYVKNKLIGFHLVSKIHEVDVCYILEEIENATKLSIEANIHWKFPLNVISIFMSKKMTKGISAQLINEVQDLQQLCEGA